MKINTSLVFTAIVIVGIGLVPNTQAVNPPPDGGYPNFTTAEGQKALFSLTTGAGNTAVGWFSLFSDVAGSFNTATGVGTLLFNTADENTAIGAAALLFNITGAANTAVGSSTLLHNTTGDFNAATGSQALVANTTGTENTADGAFAMNISTEASFNTAIGAFALSNNTGSENTAVGVDTLSSNTAGGNTAMGAHALRLNTTGFQNLAVGHNALTDNIEGSYNTGIGVGALTLNTGDGNTACGNVALFNNTGSNNTALGNVAGTNLTFGDNNIDIGYNVGGVAGESNTTRIGNSDITATYISGISGTNVAGGASVFVSSTGKLGTTTSSARFKENIKPMGSASEAILALHPVSFRYKQDMDPDGIPQFGLIAEEVEKINPDLIIRDRQGKPQTVRYEQVNAMLLNEFLKEHSKVQEQQATITQLESTLARQKKNLQATVAQLTARLDEQAAQIQKVTAQLVAANTSGGGLETSKPAPQLVVNP
jgi:hypothetical protein